ncbi:MAG: Uma2 family endonuclease [Candidatus Omnitrophota bacterium]|nr:MAG: Uma2 family endonuclease [Candidatus Omnitrophota bacterium]
MASFPRLDEIDYEQFITEDDTPVDSVFADKQHRLLVESLYSSWNCPRQFLACTNVGLYYHPHEPPLVPDMLLSLDVKPAKDKRAKKNRVYFTWVFGKPPDVVVEVVSNREGEENDRKFRIYQEIGVPYYVIFDPDHEILDTVLLVYELQDEKYHRKQTHWLDKVELGLTLWEGDYEQYPALWLRWCDRKGVMYPTAFEQRIYAEQERKIKEKLAAKLRALGVDPEL